MRVTKFLAALVSGTLLAGAAVVAVAAPASANDESPVVDGAIYWFSTAGPLSGQTAATQIKSGSGTVRPWVTLAAENPCPAGTVNMVTYVRIPQSGEPEINWNQIQMGAVATAKDADGRFYTTVPLQADRMTKPEILAYNLANGGTGTFPFISVCKTATAATLASFRTTITVTGTTSADIAWTIASPDFTGGGGGTVAVATTTALSAAASGADLVLTAAVSPAAAAGQVTFAEGATTLGTATVAGGSAAFTVSAPAAGAHTYTASFVPTDAAAYAPSQGTTSVTVSNGPSGQVVLTVPAAPPAPDGALTLSVPFDTPVALAGSRAADNSRVIASGAFPTVTVTDTRRDALLTAWEVNAQASDFTGTGGTLGAKYLGWTPVVPTMTPESGSPLVAQAGAAVASFLDNTASAGLSASARLGIAATPGRGVTALGAQLNLAAPGTTAEGAYTSTVTVTLVGG